MSTIRNGAGPVGLKFSCSPETTSRTRHRFAVCSAEPTAAPPLPLPRAFPVSPLSEQKFHLRGSLPLIASNVDSEQWTMRFFKCFLALSIWAHFVGRRDRKGLRKSLFHFGLRSGSPPLCSRSLRLPAKWPRLVCSPHDFARPHGLPVTEVCFSAFLLSLAPVSATFPL